MARTERDIHPKERKPNQIGATPEERALIERIVGNGLVDVGRTLDPDNDNLFTWWAPWRNLSSATSAGGSTTCSRPRRSPSRAKSSVVQREIGTSDHGPVVVDFAF